MNPRYVVPDVDLVCLSDCAINCCFSLVRLTVWEHLPSRFGTSRTLAVCVLSTVNVCDICSMRYSGFGALFETQEVDYSVAA